MVLNMPKTAVVILNDNPEKRQTFQIKDGEKTINHSEVVNILGIQVQ